MENQKFLLLPKLELDHSSHDVGVIIARFQVPELHEAHKALIDYVSERHKKVVILLGVARIMYSKSDPLDFATREQMIKLEYPNVVILYVLDQPNDSDWSKDVDKAVFVAYGERSAILYGSRDSFIPYYSGRNPVQELGTTGPEISGTKMRALASRQLQNSFDWRAGSIHAINSQRDVTWSTVDIIPISTDGKAILIAKRSTEALWRFIGGFVERLDPSREVAASRELFEESNLSVSSEDLIYLGSSQIADPRYLKTGSGIMTSIYLAPISFSRMEEAKGGDDIHEVRWIDRRDLSIINLVEEHKAIAELLEANEPKIVYLLSLLGCMN